MAINTLNVHVSPPTPPDSEIAPSEDSASTICTSYLPPPSPKAISPHITAFSHGLSDPSDLGQLSPHNDEPSPIRSYARKRSERRASYTSSIHSQLSLRDRYNQSRLGQQPPNLPCKDWFQSLAAQHLSPPPSDTSSLMYTGSDVDSDLTSEPYVPPSPALSRFSGRLRSKAPPPIRLQTRSSFATSDRTSIISNTSSATQEPIPTGKATGVRSPSVGIKTPPDGDFSFVIVSPPTSACRSPPRLARSQAQSLPPITPGQEMQLHPPHTGRSTYSPLIFIQGQRSPYSASQRHLLPTGPSGSIDTLSPLRFEFNLTARERREDLAARTEKCIGSIILVKHSLGTFSQLKEPLETLCCVLFDDLSAIIDALKSAPEDSESLARQFGDEWQTRYEGTLESLERNIDIFYLLEQDIGKKPPRCHRIDDLMEKLRLYSCKFEEIKQRLTSFHEKMDLLALHSELRDLQISARSDLEEERLRRSAFKAASINVRERRKELRAQIRERNNQSRKDQSTSRAQ